MRQMTTSWLRRRRQRGAQLGARPDPELREHAVQVRADRAMREVEPLPDLAVGEPVGRELGDLQLLGGELVARLGHAAPAAFPGRAQLPPRVLAPRNAPEGVERV